MSPDYFQTELSKIAKDLRLLYDQDDKMYWIVQQRASYSGIVLPGNRNTEAFFKIFPVKPHPDGTFRNPDERDLVVAMQAVVEGQKMWKDAHAYMKKVDDKDNLIKQNQRNKQIELMTEVAKDVRNSNKIRIFT